MHLEISIPDGITWLEFKKAAPPDGVTAQIDPPPQQFSTDIAINISAHIDVSIHVPVEVVATFILAAFAKYLRKYPDAKCQINRREIRLERTEIVRLIEEERSKAETNQTDEARD